MIYLLTYFYRQIRSDSIISSILLSTNLALILLYFLAGKNFLATYYIEIILILNLTCFTNQIERIFKHDFDTGVLDHLMITSEIGYLIIVKFLFYLLLIIFSQISNLALALFMFHIESSKIIYKLAMFLPISIILISNLVLMASIRLYFEKNISLISTSILPFMISPYILAGIYLSSSNVVYLYFLMAIALIIAPLTLFFTKFLIKDIYNN